MIGRKPITDLAKEGLISQSIYFAITAGFLLPLLDSYIPFIGKPASFLLCDGSVVTRPAPHGNWATVCLYNGAGNNITVSHYIVTGLVCAAVTFIVFALLLKFTNPKFRNKK